VLLPTPFPHCCTVSPPCLPTCRLVRTQFTHTTDTTPPTRGYVCVYGLDTCLAVGLPGFTAYNAPALHLPVNNLVTVGAACVLRRAALPVLLRYGCYHITTVRLGVVHVTTPTACDTLRITVEPDLPYRWLPLRYDCRYNTYRSPGVRLLLLLRCVEHRRYFTTFSLPTIRSPPAAYLPAFAHSYHPYPVVVTFCRCYTL